MTYTDTALDMVFERCRKTPNSHVLIACGSFERVSQILDRAHTKLRDGESMLWYKGEIHLPNKSIIKFSCSNNGTPCYKLWKGI